MTKKLLFATSNKGKADEVKRILSGLQGWEIRFLDRAGINIRPPEETGKDFKENAAIKAAYYSNHFKNNFTAAEDSGLSVGALGGAPGIFSARYKGISGDEDKIGALLKAMEGLPPTSRNAWFEAVINLVLPDGKSFFFSGRVDGHISLEPRGDNGFGYDPVFVPENESRTFAEMDSEEKDDFSHRKKALMKLKEFLIGTAR